MDDLSDLQARVAAAQEKLRLNADDQRKYGLRLNDVVTIVEGSLARQQDEMKRLQDAAVSLRLERDANKIAEGQTKSLYEAALLRLNLLQTQNEQLRAMVMTLLNVIEGRESAGALQSVLQRLETSVHEIAAAPALDEAVETAVEDVAETVAEEPASEPAPVEEPIADSVADEFEEEAEEPVAEIAEPDEAEEIESAEAIEAADEAAVTEDEITDIEVATPAVEAAVEEEMPIEEAVAAEDDAAEDDIAEDDIAAAAEEPLQMVAEDAIVPEAAEEEIAGEEIAGIEIPGIEIDGAEVATGDSEESLDDALSEDMPEDLGDMTMNGHRDIVTDADALVADEMAGDDAASEDLIEMEDPAPASAKIAALPEPDETLVSALLDAEKALIEAGASGVANINSPVAEIIRRISLRTREFSEASGS